jgi:hypothetical protein
MVRRMVFGLLAASLMIGIAPGAALAQAARVQAAGAVSGRQVPSAAGLSPGEGTGAGWCTTYGAAGVKGLFSYDSVWACGPDDTTGPTPFDSNGTASFQCVELSERFLWAVDGLAPIFGSDVDGAALVSLYHSAHPSVAVGSPGPSSLPQPGDVMSFNEGGDIDSSAGHTAVVVSAPNSGGNFTIMSQNWDNTAGEETAHIDMTGAHDGHVQLPGSTFWNTAPYLELKPPSGFEAAFQANTGDLWTYSSASGAANLKQGMKAGTSPGIAALATGGFETAFQANTGDLIAVGPKNYGTGLAMKAGTSPGIAALAGGGFEVAFQASNGDLYLYSSASGETKLGLGMMAGTSPSIAASGSGFEVAFQANTGDLWTYTSASGAANLKQGMKAGTSPAIAAVTGGYEIAFQANTGALFVVGAAKNLGTGLGMMAGTSPAIAG